MTDLYNFPGTRFPGFYCQVKEYVTFLKGWGDSVLEMSHMFDVCLKHLLSSSLVWKTRVMSEFSVHVRLDVKANNHLGH